MVLRDRYGSELGPFLKKGHQAGAAATTLTDAQIVDLAHFLRQRVNDSLRGSPIFQPQERPDRRRQGRRGVLQRRGQCSTCHSPTGDLAGIGTRLRAGRSAAAVSVPRRPGRGGAAARPTSVADGASRSRSPPASGQRSRACSLQMDDFNVTLRDASGVTRTFKRTPALKVVKNDPLAAHRALLDTSPTRTCTTSSPTWRP